MPYEADIDRAPNASDSPDRRPPGQGSSTRPEREDESDVDMTRERARVERRDLDKERGEPSPQMSC